MNTFIFHKSKWISLLVITWLLTACLQNNKKIKSQVSDHAFNIPSIKNIKIDGKLGDWEEHGFVISMLTTVPGDVRPKNNLDAAVRMGWDQEGLLIAVTVLDDKAVEGNSANMIWAGDSIELFVADKVGSKQYYQALIAPGMQTEHPELRYLLVDRRENKTGAIECQFAREKIKGGYIIEAKLPWKNLGLKPEVGRELGFQIYVNDSDKPKENPFLLAWYRGENTSSDSSHMHRIRLETTPSATPILINARAEYDQKAMSALIHIIATPNQANKPVTLKVGDREVSSGKLTIGNDGRVRAQIIIPTPPPTQVQGRYDVLVKVGESIADIVNVRNFRDILNLKERAQRLRKKYHIDESWNDLKNASDSIRRHRGMIARGLAALSESGNIKAKDRLDMLEDTSDILAHLDKGEDALGNRRNSFWSAYYSTADGSGQQFVTVLPKGFKADKKYPLIVDLHGSRIRPYPWQFKDEGEEDTILVCPWARGDLSYRGLGENDILEVIRYMQKWYKIDSNRIYLTGFSMGGGGTWRLASIYPNIFAAIAPRAGFTNHMPLENLRNIPTINQHGHRDWAVTIDNSRWAVDRLKNWGYPIVHIEDPRGGHSQKTQYPSNKWMLQHRRNSSPQRITLSCNIPAQGRAYWLAIRHLTNPHKRAQVNAFTIGNGSHQTLSLDTDNISVLELNTHQMPIDINKKLLIQINNENLTQATPLPKRLFLVRKENKWVINNSWKKPITKMRPYQSGAALNLFNGEPLLIVYGTKKGKKRSEFLGNIAENMAKHGGPYWTPMAWGKILVKPDSEVKLDDMLRYNLILIGGPSDSDLINKIMDKMPFEINDKQELIAGERKPVSLKGAGLRLFHYNPLAPKRLVFLIVTDEQSEEANKWYQNSPAWLTGSDGYERGDQPDLIVQTFGGGNRYYRQFTHAWKWLKIPGQEIKIIKDMIKPSQRSEFICKIIHQISDADFTFRWVSNNDRQEYDAKFFTLADMSIKHIGGSTLTATISGANLIKVHEKLIAKTKLHVFPLYTPKTINPKRIYRIAMSTSVASSLAHACRKNLENVKAGPNWQVKKLINQMFGLPKLPNIKKKK
ncbi:MAG: hypothetical protein COA79_23075 [Planctomycetota bacterium]|nr:MAG: hypothetical protein COA79_23075 [Planctomycetota bacterium]